MSALAIWHSLTQTDMKIIVQAACWVPITHIAASGFAGQEFQLP